MDNDNNARRRTLRYAYRPLLTSLQTCVACWLLKPATDSPTKPSTPYCEHPIQTCIDCVRTWFTTRLARVYQPCSAIQCPDCDVVFTGGSIAGNAPWYTIREFVDRNHRIIQSMQPGSRWCLQAGCGASIEVGREKLSCDCKTCGAKACLVCDRPWHEDETCAEYAERSLGRLVEEKVSERVVEVLKVAGRIKSCPNCRVLCEKDRDLPARVRCSRCMYWFNWAEV